MLLQPAKIPAKTDFVELVYNVLVDAIIDGTLTPGERITQEEIAEQLHVSRSPVLQALRLLKKDGLIEDAPHAPRTGDRPRRSPAASPARHGLAHLRSVRLF